MLVDAGDRVPADGRVIVAATLQIEEGALTGESVAVEKSIDPVPGAGRARIGDRSDMAFMNTNVTRGHGEILVTTTGMGSEVGHIAHMLAEQKAEKSPLTKQVDRLTVFIILAALFAFVAIMVMGLAQGRVLHGALRHRRRPGSRRRSPTPCPLSSPTILSVGSMNMAKQNAIMKRLPSVETLGSTSAINSDKTGTLTLNQMTVARDHDRAPHHYTVTGEGYSLRRPGAAHDRRRPSCDLDYVMLPVRAVQRLRTCTGRRRSSATPPKARSSCSPQKGGVDVKAFRENHPRIGEVPFDSDYKFMATFHTMPGPDGTPVVRAYVKGAPDVILDRSTSARMPGGRTERLTEEMRAKVLAENDRIARQGLRVLAFAQREFDPAAFDPSADLMALMQDLEMSALVGEVDPPRAEATTAIAEARQAGIRVRMITGDHAVTAEAIAHELGIEGRAVTGADFAALDDDAADRQVDEIGVFARVAPEHKVRLVEVLKRKGNIVAMTGDGVNDAPAIGAADIGIAMGITGTDVAKGAAKMILADDNFATIVKAVDRAAWSTTTCRSSCASRSPTCSCSSSRSWAPARSRSRGPRC